MSEKGLTDRQRLAYWRVVSEACWELGLKSKADRDGYRRRVMREETGKWSLTQLNRTVDYDRVMRRMCVDAGKYDAAVQFGLGDFGRMVHKVEAAAREAAGTDKVLAYVEGVARRAGITWSRGVAFNYQELSIPQLRMVLQILQTQVRRMRRREQAKEVAA